MTIVLRPDQLALKTGVYDGWNAGNRNMLVVQPTGGGKSIVVSDIALDAYKVNAMQAVIAHRTELVSQMSMHIARRGIPHRLIAPKKVVSEIIAEHRRELNGYSFINPDANCAVVGVDTLLARKEALAKWCAQVDRWVIDEAHHVLRRNKWGKAVELFPRAYGLGVTATPERADGMGLGAHHDGVFNAMVLGPTMRELINMGALTDYEIAIPEGDFQIDDDAIGSTGDFTPAKMREASERSRIVGDVVTEYIRLAYGKRGITFATDVSTANKIAARFNEAGVPAASVSAETPSEVRADYIRRFRDGRLMMLVNVDLFGEGFDVPAVEVVCMARPTASLAVYLQQFGRALRTMHGKTYGLIIDHVSNWKRHGFPDKPRMWSLDRRDKKAKKEKDPEELDLIGCRECGKPYERAFPSCPHCGATIEVSEEARRNIEQIDGDLILLDRDRLAELRNSIELESPASVAQRVASGAGFSGAGTFHANKQIEKIQTQQRLQDAIAMWGGIQRWKGRDDQQSFRRFYLTTGFDVLSIQKLERKDMEEWASKIEGWCDEVL